MIAALIRWWRAERAASPVAHLPPIDVNRIAMHMAQATPTRRSR